MIALPTYQKALVTAVEDRIKNLMDVVITVGEQDPGGEAEKDVWEIIQYYKTLLAYVKDPLSIARIGMDTYMNDALSKYDNDRAKFQRQASEEEKLAYYDVQGALTTILAVKYKR